MSAPVETSGGVPADPSSQHASTLSRSPADRVHRLWLIVTPHDERAARERLSRADPPSHRPVRVMHGMRVPIDDDEPCPPRTSGTK